MKNIFKNSIKIYLVVIGLAAGINKSCGMDNNIDNNYQKYSIKYNESPESPEKMQKAMNDNYRKAHGLHANIKGYLVKIEVNKETVSALTNEKIFWTKNPHPYTDALMEIESYINDINEKKK